MNTKKVFYTLWVIAFTSIPVFSIGRIYEIEANYSKEEECRVKRRDIDRNNPDALYTFYGADRKKHKGILGYRVIGAYLDYQMTKCKYNDKMYGEK